MYLSTCTKVSNTTRKVIINFFISKKNCTLAKRILNPKANREERLLGEIKKTNKYMLELFEEFYVL